MTGLPTLLPLNSRSNLVLLFAAVAVYCAAPSTACGQEPPGEPSAFQIKDDTDRSIAIWEGGRPVLVYNHGDVAFQARNRMRKRASYVHPIYGLDGEILTDDFPADHYHHHGLFWCWPHVKIGDREYDFWERDDIQIKFHRWLAKESQDDRATVGIENGWYIGDQCVMKEELQLVAYAAKGDSRSIDVTLTWTPIENAITLSGAEGKSYGGLSLRFAPRTNTVITVPAGRAAEDLLITKLPWSDLSAKFRGAPQPSGAALFVHPSHPDFPPEWMTREYGLLAVGWPGVNAKTLAAGEPVTCRYRLWVHRGTPEAHDIQKAYDEFAGKSISGQAPGQ